MGFLGNSSDGNFLPPGDGVRNPEIPRQPLAAWINFFQKGIWGLPGAVAQKIKSNKGLK